MSNLAYLVNETSQAYKQMKALENLGENNPEYITTRLTYEILLEEVNEAVKNE